MYAIRHTAHTGSFRRDGHVFEHRAWTLVEEPTEAQWGEPALQIVGPIDSVADAQLAPYHSIVNPELLTGEEIPVSAEERLSEVEAKLAAERSQTEALSAQIASFQEEAEKLAAVVKKNPKVAELLELRSQVESLTAEKDALLSDKEALQNLLAAQPEGINGAIPEDANGLSLPTAALPEVDPIVPEVPAAPAAPVAEAGLATPPVEATPETEAASSEPAAPVSDPAPAEANPAV